MCFRFRRFVGIEYEFDLNFCFGRFCSEFLKRSGMCCLGRFFYFGVI